MSAKATALSEKQFQRMVLALARLCGWRRAHFRPARTGKGWRTPVEGDGAGFPDTVLIHPVRRRVLYRELKTDGGRVTAEQQAWLDDLAAAGADAAVWRPADWPEIERTLKGDAPPA